MPGPRCGLLPRLAASWPPLLIGLVCLNAQRPGATETLSKVAAGQDRPRCPGCSEALRCTSTAAIASTKLSLHEYTLRQFCRDMIAAIAQTETEAREASLLQQHRLRVASLEGQLEAAERAAKASETYLTTLLQLVPDDTASYLTTLLPSSRQSLSWRCVF